jgi:hypothetical protein
MTRLTTCAVVVIIAAMMAPPAPAQRPPDLQPDLHRWKDYEAEGAAEAELRGKLLTGEARRTRDMERLKKNESAVLAYTVAGVALLCLLVWFLSSAIDLMADTLAAMVRGRPAHTPGHYRRPGIVDQGDIP